MSDKAVSSKTTTARYAARRSSNVIATALALAATAFGLGLLVLVLGALLWKGFSGLSIAVFTRDDAAAGFERRVAQSHLR